MRTISNEKMKEKLTPLAYTMFSNFFSVIEVNLKRRYGGAALYDCNIKFPLVYDKYMNDIENNRNYAEDGMYHFMMMYIRQFGMYLEKTYKSTLNDVDGLILIIENEGIDSASLYLENILVESIENEDSELNIFALDAFLTIFGLTYSEIVTKINIAGLSGSYVNFKKYDLVTGHTFYIDSMENFLNNTEDY